MENNQDRRYHTRNFFLTAGRCNAEGVLPLQALVQCLIDIATEHANRLDIGYDRLIMHNCTWVLSRIAIEMESYPGINSGFSITTWIVKSNRLYSDRAFRISDNNGNVIGYALTTWVAIDITERKGVNLDKIFVEGLPDTGEIPPVEPFRRQSVISEPDSVIPYTFRYTDIDCNRHVNSTRYIELLLNSFDICFFDSHVFSRIEIAYHAEAYFGQQVDVMKKHSNNEIRADIIRNTDILTQFRLCIRDKQN